MKIILDLDTGIDDALALAYILASATVDLIGVTGTFGNVTVRDGVANSRALLELFGRPDIPVFAGREPEGFQVLGISKFIHGDNGIGNVVVPRNNAPEQQGTAAQFLVDSFHAHDDLIIVATGPMTNLADALSLDPEFVQAQVVMMGGALTVPGNVTAWSEANIAQDPESADTILRSGMDVTMIGLDVTHQTVLTKADTAQLRGRSTRGDALADMADYYIDAYAHTAPHLGGCSLHDPLAAAVAVDPSLVLCLPIHLTVDLTGPTRGRTIGDSKLTDPSTARTRAAVGVEASGFHAEFMSRLCALAECS